MSETTSQPLAMATMADLKLHSVACELLTYRGKRAVHLTERGDEAGTGSPLAVLVGPQFRDGVIEAKVAGVPHADSLGFSRGFVGIAFRVQSSGTHYECFFLRPTNGR